MSPTPSRRPSGSADGATPAAPLHVAIIMDGNGRWAKRARPAAHARPPRRRRGAASARSQAAPALGVGVADRVRLLHRELAPPGRRSRRADGPAQAPTSRATSPGWSARACGCASSAAARGCRADILRDHRAAPRRAPRTTTASTCRSPSTTAARPTSSTPPARFAADVAAGAADPPTTSTRRRSAAACRPPASPPPDLIVRTCGEQRLSNFLLWEAAYAELVFQDVLWPDYGAEHLKAALDEFTAARAALRRQPRPMTSSPPAKRFDWTQPAAARRSAAIVLAPSVLARRLVRRLAVPAAARPSPCPAGRRVGRDERARRADPRGARRSPSAVLAGALRRLSRPRAHRLDRSWPSARCSAAVARARGVGERPADAAFGVALHRRRRRWRWSGCAARDQGLRLDAAAVRRHLGGRHRRLRWSAASLKGPKLWPRFSPNKTWSGFVGGLVAAPLAAVGGRRPDGRDADPGRLGRA